MKENIIRQKTPLNFGESQGETMGDTETTLHQFLNQLAAKEPVPGGGSVAALNGAIASALTAMVSKLTINKKGYEDRQILMKEYAEEAERQTAIFLSEMNRDSEAYSKVFECYKLPKNTGQEITVRTAALQEAVKHAAVVPMEVARRAFNLMKIITEVALKGNKNAVTDACVAMMSARTAVLGALMNVRINLNTIKDKEFVRKFRLEADELEQAASEKEKQLLNIINMELGQ